VTGATVSEVTAVFDVATGSTLWTVSYLGPAERAEGGAVTFSPGSDRVFVTGVSYGAGSDDLTTIAYDAHTGQQLWLSQYNGPADGSDLGTALAATPDGATLVVTGASHAATKYDIVTLAIGQSDGATHWVDRYDSPALMGSTPVAIATSPDSTRAFVTGTTNRRVGAVQETAFVTLAYTLGS
jgi:hypothetical protein